MTNSMESGSITLSSATGCLYKENEHTYLITNWHVLSGRHAQTKAPLHTSAALPDQLRVYFPIDGQVSKYIVQTYPLRGEDGKYLWLEHQLSNEVDVGAMEINPPQGIATFLINDALTQPGLGLREDFFFVTQDVWVIGFPKGIRVGGLPIWKKATIAADPAFSVAIARHKVLIDTATRDGMSGSPVMFVNKSLSPIAFDGHAQEVDFPSAKLLLGIYSGRIAGDDELAAQIGIVWSADSIPELVIYGKYYMTEDAVNESPLK